VNQLKKNISVVQGVVLAICTIIGSGLLGLPGLAIETGGATASAIAWPLVMVISLPLVFIFLTLSLDVQDSGGVASYAAIAIGKWAETAVTFVLALTFMLCIPVGTYMGSSYIQKISGLPPSATLYIAVGILFCSTAVNYYGIKPAAWINKASVFSLLALIIFIAVNNGDIAVHGLSAYRQSFENWRQVSFVQVWTVCAVLFWAFLGWENLSFGSEEVAGGKSAIKWIFGVGFVAVSLIYGLLALIAAGAHESGMNISGVTGLLVLVESSRFSAIAYILIMLIVLANVNAWVFAASRLMFSSGRNRILPAALGTLSEGGVPRVSLLSMLVVYVILVGCIHTSIVPLATGLMVANQNFIVLYVAAILCYAKLNRGLLDRVIAALGLLSCGFLISGFGRLLLLPLALIVIGYFIHTRRNAIFAATTPNR
jgi:amino acid transporter